MKRTIYNTLLALLMFGISSTIIAQEVWVPFANPKVTVSRKSLERIKNTLLEYHPKPFGDLTDSQVNALMDSISATFPKDSILMTQKVRELRKFLDIASYNDPHVGFTPVVTYYTDGSITKMKRIPVLPLWLLVINDSVLVYSSYYDQIKKGDRLISMNNISMDSILNMNPRLRYMVMSGMQAFCNFAFSPNYHVTLERNHEIISLNLKGASVTKDVDLIDKERSALYQNNKTGFYCIPSFMYNKYTIKRLQKFIIANKKRGMENLIIDLRQNSGGSGQDFDKLISLFSNKDSIPYSSEVKLKVSKITYKDYDFLTKADSGKIVSLPIGEYFPFIPLHPEMYPGKLNIYVLISKYTASMAASFANIIQYNNLGLLVGEPLKHNALNYGEASEISTKLPAQLHFSTSEIDEYTKGIHGVVYPDIPIPYIAAEYMKGGDPILEKLLHYIETKDEN